MLAGAFCSMTMPVVAMAVTMSMVIVVMMVVPVVCAAMAVLIMIVVVMMVMFMLMVVIVAIVGAVFSVLLLVRRVLVIATNSLLCLYLGNFTLQVAAAITALLASRLRMFTRCLITVNS